MRNLKVICAADETDFLTAHYREDMGEIAIFSGRGEDVVFSIVLDEHKARRLGEWLIEAANRLSGDPFEDEEEVI